MSVSIPVSASSLRAAFAVGASPNTPRPCTVEVLGGGGEHLGLAGPGGSDDQHQPVVAGDHRGGFALHRIQPVRPHRCVRWAGRVGRRSPRTRCVPPAPGSRGWCDAGPMVRSTPTGHHQPGAECRDRCGSRSMHDWRITSTSRSSTSTQPAPSKSGFGRVVSQAAWSTSRRCHAERRSTISAIKSW